MAGSESNHDRDCRTGWLLVEIDFSSTIREKKRLRYALQCMGRNPSEKTINWYWQQCGGLVSFPQFCSIMKREKRPNLDSLLGIFQKMDRNKDGFIDTKELMKILSKRGERMAEEEMKVMLNDVCPCKDGKLDYAELCQRMMHTIEDCAREAERRTSTKRGYDHNKPTSVSQSQAKKHLPLGESEERHDKYKKKRVLRAKSDAKLKFQDRPPVVYQLDQKQQLSDVEAETLSSLEEISSDLPGSSASPSLGVSPVSVDGIPFPSIPGQATTGEGHASSDRTSTKANESVRTNPPLPELEEEKVEAVSPGHAADKEESDVDVSISEELEGDEVEEGAEEGGSNKEDGDRTLVLNQETSDPLTQHASDREVGENGRGKNEQGNQEVPAENSSATNHDLHSSSTSQQPDHSKPSNGTITASNQAKTQGNLSTAEEGVLAPASNAIYGTSAPKPPRGYENWNSISGKGCFYVDKNREDNDDPQISCHQYTLTLPKPTHVWIEIFPTAPGSPDTDVYMFVFHTDSEGKPTQLITYTQHRDNKNHWVCRLDLEAGCYALVPFTSGCILKNDTEPEEDSTIPLVDEEEGKIVLTLQCKEALTEVFHRLDLNGSGAISRTEFDYFQERSSSDVCDDATWNVVKENFEMNEDEEVTLKGFLDLHAMTANDEEGGEAELWDVLQSMGYNKQLKLIMACPFEFEVFTEESEGEIEIESLSPFSPILEPALCNVVKERGIDGTVRDGKDSIVTHTLITPHLTTIVVENKDAVVCQVQLDISKSTNYAHNADSAVKITEIQPHSMIVGYHMMPKDPSQQYSLYLVASLILS